MQSHPVASQWNLKRLYPGDEPDLEITDVDLNYAEDAAFESPAEPDTFEPAG
jgi:hypothetical protein